MAATGEALRLLLGLPHAKGWIALGDRIVPCVMMRPFIASQRNAMNEARPKAIFLCAAKVGGILANDTAPVPFLYDNLAIAANVIHAAAANEVEKLLYLGSS